jgi:hypothetical protein
VRIIAIATIRMMRPPNEKSCIVEGIYSFGITNEITIQSPIRITTIPQKTETNGFCLLPEHTQSSSLSELLD